MALLRQYSSDILLKKYHHFFLSSIGFTSLLTKLINHKFFYTYTKIITTCIFPNGILLQIMLFKNSKIRINLKDYYWMRIISKNYEYESEVKNYLSHFDSKNFVFVDLGANIGYWSLFCSELPNCEKIIAVEPHPEIFKNLEMNLSSINKEVLLLNHALILSYEKAIGFRSSCNYEVLVGSCISYTNEKSLLVSVSNFHHAHFVSDYLFTNLKKNLIIKIDIEGEELNFVSSLNFDLENTSLIYEDHGRDYSHKTSSYLFENNWNIFHYNKHGFHHVKTIEDIAKFKKRKDVGYNFLATKQSIVPGS